MRKVMVSEHKQQADKRWKLEEKGEAVFHQFGCNYEEFESGPANYTTAIIEWPDGTVGNVPVERVRFLEDANVQVQRDAAGGLSAAVVVLAASCPECGSSDTEWHCSQYTDSGVVDGRLRMHEVKTRFFLGCNSCSETIRIVGGDELARFLTEAANI
jgi:hypothetical protein